MNRIDVLNLEWTSGPSRDRLAATLIANYLRFHGLGVEERSVHDAFWQINKLRPQLLFINSTTGAPENLAAMKYAVSRNSAGVSLIAEGNIRESNVELEMIWGWNHQQILLEDLSLQWTTRSRDITLKHHPELEDRIRVSGGVGFDYYKFGARANRRAFLEKYGKSGFSSVVGVGCWDFGILSKDDIRYDVWGHVYTDEECSRFLRDRDDFHSVLAQLIERNPGVLFLLKEHPGVLLGRHASAIEELDAYANVLVLKNEEPINDCIWISDLWIVYESTTALEAWLMGKPTALLNPSGRDFPRDVLHEGSPDYGNVEPLEAAIQCATAGRPILDFESREKERTRLVETVIQWQDGLNHVRAGNEILDILEREQSKRPWKQESVAQSIARYHQHLKWLATRLRRKSKCPPPFNFSTREVMDFSQKVMNEQMAYYHQLGLSAADLRQVRGL